VDEALAVGDMFFQAKCMSRMRQMMDNGVTVLFVSHDSGAVKSLCNQAILLDNGKLISHGSADQVVEQYFHIKVKNEQLTLRENLPQNNYNDESQSDKLLLDVSSPFRNNDSFLKKASFQRIQNGKSNFVNIQLLNKHKQEIQSVDYDQEVILRMAIEINEDHRRLEFGYHIRDKNGSDIIYSDSVIEDKSLISVKKGEKYIIDWQFKASLMQGIYNIACGLSIPIDLGIGKVDFCDFVPLGIQFNVSPRKGSALYGSVHWDNSIQLTKI